MKEMNPEANGIDMSDNSQAQLPDTDVLHPLELIQTTEELSVWLKGQWIDSVEQAVGYLSFSDCEINGKAEFLVQAREILGEDAFLKYTTPAPTHPMGCIDEHLKDHVIVVTDSATSNDSKKEDK